MATGGRGGEQGVMSGHNAVADPKRSVIFTADDFGLADALNDAVVLAHRRGLLSCASLMAAGPRTDAALGLARDLPGLCLGVHLTLIQGRAALPPEAVPHLVDSRGFFPSNPMAAGWPCQFHPLRAQSKRV